MAIIAITTSNSIRVKPRAQRSAGVVSIFLFIAGIGFTSQVLDSFLIAKLQAPDHADACCNYSLASAALHWTVIAALVAAGILVLVVSVAVAVQLPAVLK